MQGSHGRPHHGAETTVRRRPRAGDGGAPRFRRGDSQGPDDQEPDSEDIGGGIEESAAGCLRELPPQTLTVASRTVPDPMLSRSLVAHTPSVVQRATTN